ncbi:hypothetical protein PACTADRAFT_49556 [Pachysolen tannophilus NRRL Y-2460]|uniref:NADH:ubiquinone reductase (non-electrogenic) n=1 Tax=Pachysolen tannophilus NRRL Y-2460 TaxID=669874 RepID=A0A1E4TWP7_PACTA|nr:hypothetical protein PACTADRAFT_49556 [Pachysolen tannophilus NRRL Y-2460]
MLRNIKNCRSLANPSKRLISRNNIGSASTVISTKFFVGSRFNSTVATDGKVTGSTSFHKTTESKRIISYNHSDNGKPNIVILGTGWGSISLLKNIDSSKYNIIIISPRNYFLFTPLLPSCPVGTVDEKSIMEPVVNFASKKKGDVTYYEAEATDIDPSNNSITFKSVNNATSLSGELKIKPNTSDLASVHYDYLVVGVGATPNTFGIPGVEEHGFFLKEIPDSKKIRNKFVECVEKANLLPKGDPERKKLLTIVVVGGGPTGVETAGELSDFIEQDLKHIMPNIVDELQILLLEAMPNVLNMFETKLTKYAAKVLSETAIDLRTSTAVTKVEDNFLIAKTKKGESVKEENIPYGMLIWATGNKQRPIVQSLAKKIPDQSDVRRGLVVNENLLVKGSKNIFAIGDCSNAKLAPTAQVAHQEAEYLAKVFSKIASKPSFTEQLSKSDVSRVPAVFESVGIKPFNYIHLGALAYLGSEKAIANVTYGKRNLYSGGGLFTFFVWRVLYVSMILSVRSRFKVCADWLKIAFFGRDCFKEL